MINIENLTVNVGSPISVADYLLKSQNSIVVRDELVSTLRIISEDQRFVGQTVVIPNDCEQYGFAEGEFNLPKLLYFLADMLE